MHGSEGRKVWRVVASSAEYSKPGTARREKKRTTQSFFYGVEEGLRQLIRDLNGFNKVFTAERFATEDRSVKFQLHRTLPNAPAPPPSPLPLGLLTATRFHCCDASSFESASSSVKKRTKPQS
jgi:hypothetical protein